MKSTHRERNTKFDLFPDGSSADKSSFLPVRSYSDKENEEYSATSMPSSSLPSQYPVSSVRPSPEYSSQSPEIPTVSFSPSSSTPFVPSSNNGDSSIVTEAPIETEDLSTRSNSAQRNDNNNNLILQSLERIVASIMVSLLPPVNSASKTQPKSLSDDTDEMDLPTNVGTVTEILPDIGRLDLPDIENNDEIFEGLQQIITSIMDAIFNNDENGSGPSISPSYQASTSTDFDSSSDNSGSDGFIDDFFMDDDETEIEYVMSQDEELEQNAISFSSTPQPTGNPTISFKPTISVHPSIVPSTLPSISPSKAFSALPSGSPSISVQPSRYPSITPSVSPSTTLSALPSGSPSLSTQPSSKPSTRPSSKPSTQPSSKPSTQPSSKPSTRPSSKPSTQPSSKPSTQPSSKPSTRPSSKPSTSPSSMPSLMPSVSPSSQPSVVPSVQPSKQPSSKPSTSPSSMPSLLPSLSPSSLPSLVPSVQPSKQPSSKPSTSPSSMPSLMPSVSPSSQPSVVPSVQPSKQPSSKPSTSPSSMPSSLPSSSPSFQPSVIPSLIPSLNPSSYPSIMPSVQPSKQPSSKPSTSPSSIPSFLPSSIPSILFSRIPSVSPSTKPSIIPSFSPSLQPSVQPSIMPSFSPSSTPSIFPSLYPSTLPSLQPSTRPSSIPSVSPSSTPSIFPSQYPSSFPSIQASKQPSSIPSVSPSSIPSFLPSSIPSILFSRIPSVSPSTKPSIIPSFSPSLQPSVQPSIMPSFSPSSTPSIFPSLYPSTLPSLQPSTRPSSIPSVSPSSTPSIFPSQYPSSFPSVQPSKQPSSIPSVSPSFTPSIFPSRYPSSFPSVQPSKQPSSKPSISPSSKPSVFPSRYPSSFPSVQPSKQPSSKPSISPSSTPSIFPSRYPSSLPSNIPTRFPTRFPSNQPSVVQSLRPSVYPSVYPTLFPSDLESPVPTESPSISVYPSMYPSVLSSSQPSMYPSISPSDQLSWTPSLYPTIFPSDQPSGSPSLYPTIFPSSVPSKIPSVHPSVSPSNKPSVTPSFQPTIMPTVTHKPSDESQKIPDFETSCILKKTEVSICEDDPVFPCRMYASQGYCNHTDYYQNMTTNCQKSCNVCPPPLSSYFSDGKIQYNPKTFIVRFNLDLNVNTDANFYETSWAFISDKKKDVIIYSNESDATSLLNANTFHTFKYSCTVSYVREHKRNPDIREAFCYNFEVRDSFGDGMCCDSGQGYFGMNINNTKNETLEISNTFYDGSKMTSSFCIDDKGNIEKEKETSNENMNLPSYYPVKSIQCKSGEGCRCDSKPNLSTNVRKSDVLYDIKAQTLLGISMLSQSEKLQDVESPQYKAACWVLFDDSYQYVSKETNIGTKRRMSQQYRMDLDFLIEKGAQKRMMQRYTMAVLYFSTKPNNWEKQYSFLSSRSECEWNKKSDDNGVLSIQGSICDIDDNIISLRFKNNNLNGTILEELSELKSLDNQPLNNYIKSQNVAIEVLDLSNNIIQGSLPSVLGQLSRLNELHLSHNELEGTIHPLIFNAKNLKNIDLGVNKIGGEIPDTIVNLRQSSLLNLNDNDLSGSIPDTMYSLKNLQILNLSSNKISSSISSLIGNLKKLKQLHLSGNILSGQIPSRVGELSSLQELKLGNNTISGSIPSTVGELTLLSEIALDDNQLTGKIPESLFSLSSLRNLKLQDNDVTGSIPDQLCENDDLDLQADCQNDVFRPQVSCSCCSVCSDKTPKWDGECADATIQIKIDRRTVEYEEYSFSSDGLAWSLINDATKKRIPLSARDDIGGGSACVAFSDCISIDMISPPIFDTYFDIYWNNVRVGIREFPGSLELDNTFEYKNDPFQFNERNRDLTSCRELELTCNDGNSTNKLTFDPKSTKHVSISKVASLFGKENILDSSSPQSKALCWVLQNEHPSDKLELSDTEILQRYVLAMLHYISPNGLFGGNSEYPPQSHECEWSGIQCKLNNNIRVVTGISLSSEFNPIINGTLIEELGGLQFLEKLELNQMQLRGTIPETFSNLWSLENLDLSQNELTGTLPKNMFLQLNKLEYIDLSDNEISGRINEDIGSFSRISSLNLNKNQLTGSLPLHGFNWYDLEYLDVSENVLNSVEFLHVIKHTKLKSLDLSTNFFVGSLHKDTFTSLSKLEYLNISQNDFSGTIPSTFPDLSNITHFDMHANRFKGVIPLGITDLSYIQSINLQGNKLTGSLPSQINQLQNLDTLILSHNEIKGVIPFDPNSLKKMDKLHLHGNSLAGEAPPFDNMTSYITDCGYPAVSLKPISCPTCNKCCNSDGNCQEKTSKDFSQVQLTMMFVCSIIGFVSICYMMKYYITHNKHLKTYFFETVALWNAMLLISDKSVYHFLLARNKLEWLIAVVCIVFQSATLFLFVHSADIANETSDREYTMTCSPKSLECEDSIKISTYGEFVFGLILTIWLLKDIVGSAKLMMISFQHRNIDFFFAGASVFTVTMLSLWSSIIYIIAIAVKNTDLIKDAVVLLFVIEIDERLYELVENINPEWVKDIERNMRDDFVYVGNDLIISSFLVLISSSLKSFRRMISKIFQRIVRIFSRRKRRDSDVAV